MSGADIAGLVQAGSRRPASTSLYCSVYTIYGGKYLDIAIAPTIERFKMTSG
jgi:hypothetical protein